MIQLFTDSDTDMTLQDCQKYGYKLISMPYIINGQQIYPYRDFEKFDCKGFYDILRKGTLPTTCALNETEYMEYFEPEFAAGNDILYVHFSSAMSGTFESMRLAKEQLAQKYPDRKLYTIDTMGITVLSKNIVEAVGQMILDGATVDEVLTWADGEVLKYTCYFYADDLKFFAKSGRVSGIAATMGGIFGIKPIIHMNDQGQMVSVAKEMGRKKALKRIVNIVAELQDNIKDYRVIIGHTDALEIAQTLGNMLTEQYGELNIEYAEVNPTAGSHCGPDVVGVCFHCKHR